ncbi:MAG: CHAT domain-containing protein [Rubricoccaceae bacterium]
MYKLLLLLTGVLVVLLNVRPEPASGRGDCHEHLAYVRSFGINPQASEDLQNGIDRALACFGEDGSDEVAELRARRYRSLARLGRYAEAFEAFEQYLAYREQIEPELNAATHELHAETLRRFGRNAESLETRLVALRYAARASPLVHALTLSRAADHFRLVRDTDTAELYYRESLRIAEKHRAAYPELENVVLYTPVFLAGLLIERYSDAQGTAPLQEAVRMLEASRTTLEAAGKPELDMEIIQASLWLAQAHRALGAPARALSEARRAQALAETDDVLRYLWLSWALAEQAMGHKALGNLEEARRLMERAVALDETQGNPGFASTSLRDLALIEEAIARRDGQSLEQPIALLRKSVAYAEAERAAYGASDWSVATFAGRQQPYRHLVRLLLDADQPAEALAVLDRTRARHLRDIRRRHRLRAHLDARQALTLDSLNQHLLNARYRRIRTDDAAQRSAAVLDISRLQREITRLTGFEPEAEDEPDLIVLPPDRTVLAYFLDENGSFVFLAKAGRLSVVPIPGSLDELNALVGAAGYGPAYARTAATGEPEGDPMLALYERLLAPVADRLAPGEPVTIIPEGMLAALPFASLRTRPADAAGDHYLIRERAVAQDLAIGLIHTDGSLETRSARRKPLLAFGRSTYEDARTAPGNSPRAHPAAGPGSAQPGSAPRPLAEADLPDLPGAGREAVRVGRLTPGAAVFTDRDATEERFWRRSAGAQVVHVASHAVMDPNYPLHSYLLLYGSATHDGRLHLYELQEQPLAADLVVLSACNTATGEHAPGEGMIGLQYAMRAAGAQSLVATLWPADDEAMVFLMERFYAGLHAGLPKDEALREAQVAYLDANTGRATISPFYWAGLVLYGDPSPIAWVSGHRWTRQMLTVFAVLGVLALAGLLVWTRIRPALYARRRPRAVRQPCEADHRAA